MRHMLLNPKKDDLLMDDAKVTSWRELCMWDGDKDKWRVRYVYGIGDKDTACAIN